MLPKHLPVTALEQMTEVFQAPSYISADVLNVFHASFRNAKSPRNANHLETSRLAEHCGKSLGDQQVQLASTQARFGSESIHFRHRQSTPLQ